MKSKVLIVIFNILIFSIYILNYDIPSRYLLVLLYSLLGISLFAILTIKLTSKVFRFLQDIQVSFFSVALIFILLEFLYVLSPSLIPLQIRNYLETSSAKERKMMVEYLDESPYVKFKANTTIKSQGHRGTDRQFVYEWETDDLGFKNLYDVAHKDKVDIVAIGDSFTEGMGVATDKIWSSILTANGYSTYNLGVQAYAPIQLEGSLRKYGINLKPDYIIIGYTRATFQREGAFFNMDNEFKNKKFVGGIDDIANADKELNIEYQKQVNDEIKVQAKYLISALYLFSHDEILKIIKNKYVFGPPKIKGGKSDLFEKYGYEISAIGGKGSVIEKIKTGSEEWLSTLKRFDNIITMGNKINAKIILLYFPSRGVIYYEAATEQDLPKWYIEKTESSLLKKYAEKNNIFYIDPTEKLKNYMNNIIDKDIIVTELPYLEIDGHMANKGHEIIANEVVELLDSKRGLNE